VSRRKAGTLLPLESEIVELALELRLAGRSSFHGFWLAQQMRERSGSRSLTAHGTLYKALGRLEELGLLRSRWEDAGSVSEGRPRRRLYELTGRGVEIAEAARAVPASPTSTSLSPEPA
jgi:DNA-binding PadR family transcriptional regulator